MDEDVYAGNDLHAPILPLSNLSRGPGSPSNSPLTGSFRPRRFRGPSPATSQSKVDGEADKASMDHFTFRGLGWTSCFCCLDFPFTLHGSDYWLLDSIQTLLVVLGVLISWFYGSYEYSSGDKFSPGWNATLFSVYLLCDIMVALCVLVRLMLMRTSFFHSIRNLIDATIITFEIVFVVVSFSAFHSQHFGSLLQCMLITRILAARPLQNVLFGALISARTLLWSMVVLGLIVAIFAQVGVGLFHRTDGFDTWESSLYTMMQLLAGDGWREVSDEYGSASKIFFALYLFVAVGVCLNALVAVFVDAICGVHLEGRLGKSRAETGAGRTHGHAPDGRSPLHGLDPDLCDAMEAIVSRHIARLTDHFDRRLVDFEMMTGGKRRPRSRSEPMGSPTGSLVSMKRESYASNASSGLGDEFFEANEIDDDERPASVIGRMIKGIPVLGASKRFAELDRISYGEMMSAVNLVGNWKLETISSSGIHTFTKPSAIGGGSKQVCGKARVDASPELFLEFICDYNNWSKWDPVLKSHHEKVLEPGHTVVRLELHGIFPVAGRESVYLESKIIDEHDMSVAVCGRSIEDEDWPVKKGLVRSETIGGGWHVKPVPGNPNQSDVTYAMNVDAKMKNVPSFLVNIVVSRFPGIIDKVRGSIPGCRIPKGKGDYYEYPLEQRLR